MKAHKPKWMSIRYNKEKDCFELWYIFSDQDDWSLQCSVPCMNCDKPEAPKHEFIHYSFLREMQRLASLGFVLTWV